MLGRGVEKRNCMSTSHLTNKVKRVIEYVQSIGLTLEKKQNWISQNLKDSFFSNWQTYVNSKRANEVGSNGNQQYQADA